MFTCAKMRSWVSCLISCLILQRMGGSKFSRRYTTPLCLPQQLWLYSTEPQPFPRRAGACGRPGEAAWAAGNKFSFVVGVLCAVCLTLPLLVPLSLACTYHFTAALTLPLARLATRRRTSNTASLLGRRCSKWTRFTSALARQTRRSRWCKTAIDTS